MFTKKRKLTIKKFILERVRQWVLCRYATGYLPSALIAEFCVDGSFETAIVPVTTNGYTENSELVLEDDNWKLNSFM